MPGRISAGVQGFRIQAIGFKVFRAYTASIPLATRQRQARLLATFLGLSFCRVRV